MDSDIVEMYYATVQVPPCTKCIRLLHVRAPVGSEGLDGPLRCDLSVAGLDAKPSYAALSYVWGSMSPMQDTIVCGGVDLPVSANALSALRHLRAKLGAFIIWIDAVCINQLDDDEKAQQIPLMGEIFEGATTTYFWLGESNPAKQRAMDYLSRAGLLQYYFKDGAMMWRGDVDRRRWAAYFHYCRYRRSFKRCPMPYDLKSLPWSRRILPSNGGGPSFNDIDDLLDCVWITRIWTYQEAALASNPVVVCGKSHIEWGQFSFSIIFLSIVGPSKHLLRWVDIVISRAIFQTKIGGNNVRPEQLRNYHTFCESLSRISQNSSLALYAVWAVCFLLASPVFVVLNAGYRSTSEGESYRTSKSMMAMMITSPAWFFFLLLFVVVVLPQLDPNGPYFLHWDKDGSTKSLLDSKIYDRLFDTLATRRATNPKDMSFGLHSILERYSEENTRRPINLGDSTGVIYQHLTIYMMEQTGTLSSLLLAGLKSYPNAPSWVPDFSHDLQMPLAQTHEATGRSKPYFRLDQNDHTVLVVKGISFDEIVMTSDFHRTSVKYNNAEEDIHVGNLKLILLWGFFFVEEQTAVFRWSQSLVYLFLQEVLSSAVPPIASSDLRAYLKTLSSAFPKNMKIRQRFVGPAAVIEAVTSTAWGRVTAHTFIKRRNMLQIHINIMNTLAQTDMGIFETRKGYMGCCTGKAERGDKLCLISGVAYPLVMRETLSRLRLIAMIYITRIIGRLYTLFPEVRDGYVWQNEIFKLQEAAYQESNGKIPHPRDAPLYASDPKKKMRESLPDIYIC